MRLGENYIINSRHSQYNPAAEMDSRCSMLARLSIRVFESLECNFLQGIATRQSQTRAEIKYDDPSLKP